jgi:hypothetical protein
MYAKLMHDWERRCHDRDNNRVVRPFEWGVECLDREFTNGHRPDEYRRIIEHYNESAIARSDRFFAPPPARAEDFEFDGFRLRFPSGVETAYPENNTVHARFFAAERNGRPSDCAVIVLPQWNGDEQAHVALCRGLNYFDISALRLSLPYHDWRKPKELTRADYLVSANVGRTLQAVRQAAQDIRRAADWLESQGVRRIGVMGTSVGSCVGFLAYVHDARFEVGVFNHVSSYFGDVVWQGITTAHIRRSLEEHLTREEVRRAWLSISPAVYLPRLAGHERKLLYLTARYDLTFPYDLSQIVFEECDRHGVGYDRVTLPCGHYTSGKSPFKFKVGYHIVNYFRRAWREPRGKGR